MDKSFRKGLDLLTLLARGGEPRGVTELADELHLTKSNVHRLLQTLVQSGFVQQQGNSARYACTLKLWELGALVAETIDVKQVARPFLEALAAQTQETVHLSILEGAEVLYIDKIDSSQPVRAYSRAGGRAPAHCAATGKALLAQLPDDVFRAQFAELKRYTPRTITDPDELQHDLKAAAKRGFSINREEWREGVCGLAAPIHDATGQVTAAIGISGPVDRLSPNVLRGFAPNVVEAARAISESLGYHGQPAKADVANAANRP